MACNEHITIMSQSAFLQENKDNSFENWKYWSVRQRSDAPYYIAIYDTLENYFEENQTGEPFQRIKRFLFFKKDQLTYIRFTPGDTLSKGFLLDDFMKDSIWIKHYQHQLDVEQVKDMVQFVLNTNFGLGEMEYSSHPERIYFKGDSIDLIYLYIPSDEGFGIYKTHIVSNWYSR